MKAPTQPARRSSLLATIGLFVMLAWLTLGERVFIGVSTGGRGLLPVLEVLFVLVSLTMGSATTGPRVFPNGLLTRTIAPVYVLLGALSVLAVLFRDYDSRTLLSLTIPLSALGVFCLARAARDPAPWLRVVFVAIVVHGVYGAAQLLARLSVLPSALSQWMASWDSSSQARLSDAYLVSLRSTGLFVNPNTFGSWSVLAVVVSSALFSSYRRWTGVFLGVTGVYASQSRTAWLSLLAIVLIGSLFAVLHGRIERILSALPVALVAAALAAGGALSWLVEENVTTRYRSGMNGISGVSEDADFASRVDAWRQALGGFWQQPLGTWGPPQLEAGVSIDNEYVAFLVQGGPVLLGALILAMLFPLFARKYVGRRVDILWELTVVLAISSFTSLAFEETQVMGLLWSAVVICFLESNTEQAGVAE